MKTRISFYALIITLGLVSLARADFQYGYETYQNAGQSLIVNSLGDQTTLSTFKNLGTNDFIQESAVKNQLAIDGYSVAYDYNPTAGAYQGVYGTALPAGGAPLTKLTFSGLLGNPRATQDVYVLTSEYNALNATGQSNSIDGLKQVTAQNSSDIQNVKQDILGDEFNITNQGQTLASVVTQTGVNTSNISGLTVQTAQNTTDINTVSSNLAQTDVVVNQHTQQIGVLNDNVSTLNTDVTNLSQTAVNQQGQINGLDGRVGRLEETKILADMNVTLLDEKKYSVGVFDDYDTRHAVNYAVGVRLTYKMGESYADREMKHQAQEILDLKAMIRNLAAERSGK